MTNHPGVGYANTEVGRITFSPIPGGNLMAVASEGTVAAHAMAAINLQTRLTAALAALATAPDVDPAKATRAEVSALVLALDAAWMALNPDVPRSRRGVDVEAKGDDA